MGNHVKGQYIRRFIEPTIVTIQPLHRLRIGENQAYLIGGRYPFFPEDDLGLKGSPTTVRKVFPPERKSGGIKLEDVDAEDAAKQLVEFLAKKGAI